MTILQELIKTTEKLVMEPRRRTLEDEQRAGIAAGLASGKRREYWLQQLEKLNKRYDNPPWRD